MIIADIPGCEPSSQFSGYSRGGVWHILLESGTYASSPYSCPEPEFSRSRVDWHHTLARRSIEAQKALEQPVKKKILVQLKKSQYYRFDWETANLDLHPKKNKEPKLVFYGPKQDRRYKAKSVFYGPKQDRRYRASAKDLKILLPVEPKVQTKQVILWMQERFSAEEIAEMRREDEVKKLARKAASKKATDARWGENRKQFSALSDKLRK